MNSAITNKATPSTTARAIAAIAVVRQFRDDVPASESKTAVLLASVVWNVGVANMLDASTGPDVAMTVRMSAPAELEMNEEESGIEVGLEEESEEGVALIFEVGEVNWVDGVEEDVPLGDVDSWTSSVLGPPVVRSVDSDSKLPLGLDSCLSQNALAIARVAMDFVL